MLVGPFQASFAQSQRPPSSAPLLELALPEDPELAPLLLELLLDELLELPLLEELDELDELEELAELELTPPLLLELLLPVPDPDEDELVED